MSPSEGNPDFKTAVSEWQRRHRIADNDPLLASLELWDIYLSSHSLHGAPPNLGPMASQTDRFDGSTGNLYQKKPIDDADVFPRFAALFSAALGLISGIIIGKFLM